MSGDFTPLSGAVGGLLIGLAAALLVRANGRIAGISGILNGITDAVPGERGWRLAFLAGLLGGGALALALVPVPGVGVSDLPWYGLAVAGLLVGFGTRLGSGCTSGHGICGLARLSLRSVVATLVFMVAGMATVYVVRHGLGS